MPENFDKEPIFISAENVDLGNNTKFIEKENVDESAEGGKQISFVVSYEINPWTCKNYVLPDRHLYPDKTINKSESYDSLEKALMAYSQVPEGGKKTFKIEWDNNVTSDKPFDPMNFVEFEIMSGENGYSQIHKVPNEIIEQNGSMEMLHSTEYRDIFNRLEQYVEKEEMRIPKVFFIEIEEAKNNETYIQTAIVGNNIECKFYDNHLIYQRRDMVPFANTNADLFKATLLSYIAEKVEAYGNPLITVDYNKFNEIAKEANQRDCYRKLHINGNLLNALNEKGWSVNVVATDFFYDVEFTKQGTKANVEFFMAQGDSLNDKVQETVQGRLKVELPFSDEVNESYRKTFKELGDIVQNWNSNQAKSIGERIIEYTIAKPQNKTPQNHKKDSRSL